VQKAIIPHEKYTLGIQVQCPSLEKLPKVQQYKDYYFPNKSHEDTDKYRSNFLKTDNISIRVPKITVKEDKDSFLSLKSKYGAHAETGKTGWVPHGNFKTMNNRSSVTYNILANGENSSSGAMVLKILDKKLTNKKKGVAEFSDLTRPFFPNINEKYHQYYNENKNIFHVYNGIFSHMYDAAHRNGNIVIPFRNNKNLSPTHDKTSTIKPNHSKSPKNRNKSPKGK
jgi:hypothetical protein